MKNCSTLIFRTFRSILSINSSTDEQEPSLLTG